MAKYKILHLSLPDEEGEVEIDGEIIAVLSAEIYRDSSPDEWGYYPRRWELTVLVKIP